MLASVHSWASSLAFFVILVVDAPLSLRFLPFTHRRRSAAL